jgi:hypothetical protein
VPKGYSIDSQLGTWVHTQRTVFKSSKIDPERKDKLDEIGFVFGLLEEKWNVHFDSLRQFKNDNGHCELFWAVDRFTFILNTLTNTPPLSPCITGKVPRKYKEDPKLANWISTQRTFFKNGRMILERQRMLYEIGFDFNPKDNANEEKWSLQFKRLRDYYGKHGHCELCWAVDRFTFILNTPTNTPTVSLPLTCRSSATKVQG